MYTQKLKLLFIFTLIITVTLTLGSCDLNDEEPTMYDLTVEMEGEGVIYEDGEKLLTEEEESETLEVEENTSVTLEAEPEDDWKFIKWTGDEEDEEKEISVPMDEDKSVTAHFEEKTAHFEVDITDYTDDITGEGEDIEIDYEIENTGDVEDTKDIIFSVNGEVEDSEEITLAADETYENEFIYTTKSEDVGKELDIEVASDDDADAASITVLEPEEAYFEVDIDENESCDEVSLEEELTIVAEINNTGDISDAQKVEMTFQEEVVDTKTINLDGREDTTEEFTHEVTDEAESGYTDVTIESKNDSDEHKVYVTEFADGRGTEDNPYLVETAEQLDRVRDNLDSYFKQIDDIDLSGFDNWEPIGDVDSPFSGNFNGNGYEISNLNIENENLDDVGLFGFLGDNSKVQNLKLYNINIKTTGRAGILSGYNGGTIEKCYIQGEIESSGESTGGLVGHNGGIIRNAVSKIELTGDELSGGLAGGNNGEIIKSRARGEVVSESSSIGGLTGANYSGALISKSRAKTKVKGENVVGGLSGWNGGYILKSFAESNTKGNERNVGGLVGYNYYENGVIRNSYATGDITGEANVGGIVGWNGDKVENSYAAGNVSGDDSTGGLIGYNAESYEAYIDYSYYDKNIAGFDEENGIPKSTEEMIQQDTFTPEWDFDDIWTIEEDDSYPHFQWQVENIPYPPE